MSDADRLLFELGHKSLEKYDYFLCTIAGALVAYIAQTYTPEKLDNLFSILQTVSLLFLFASFCCGIKRIQIASAITRLDYEYLEACQISENWTAVLGDALSNYKNNRTGEIVSRESIEAKHKKLLEDMQDKNSHVLRWKKLARRLGFCQFYLLLIGFLIVVVAKVLQPYQADFSQRPAINQTANKPAQSPLETQSGKQAK